MILGGFNPFVNHWARPSRARGWIALVVASIATFVRLHRVPASSAEWHGWFALLVSAAWITFGGYWVELAYLNGIRPRVARFSDSTLVLVRLAVWLIGGAVLFVCALVSRGLLMGYGIPALPQIVR